MSSMNLGMVGAAGMLSGYGIFEARRSPTIVDISVPIPDLPKEFEGFRIVQISDIHVGPTIKRGYVRRIVDQVNRINKDMICLTGDLVDGSVPSLREAVAPLKELSAPLGSFFITGNHEYYSGVDAWLEEIDKLGFTVLINEHRILEKGKGRIILAGITDYRAGRMKPAHASDPRTALSTAPKEMVKVLLAHQPQSVFEASKAGVDLQLSGHTHGGQYVPWNLLVDWYQPFIKGLYRYENTWLYVNRGTGYWGPPLRQGVPTEITVISLHASL
jgi:predicted MPP superfamily phosphohydrolase